MVRRVIFCLFFLIPVAAFGWGFWAHKQINRMACFTLPPELFSFYKQHIEYITSHAISPDRRRYVDTAEAARHFIDYDYYKQHYDTIPQYWNDAVALIGEDSLRTYGIVPWHINLMVSRLTDAFMAKNIEQILYLSAAIGHYVGDAHVPLHCTENYNGQQTGQEGIHAFWESRIPELFAEDYDKFVGRAKYIERPQREAWKIVEQSYAAVDSVLKFEKLVNEKFTSDKKFAYEQRGRSTVKVYSREYSIAYTTMLDGQIERRMQSSILEIGSFWYTAWVNAGSPDLTNNTGVINDSLEQQPDSLQMIRFQPKGHID